MKIYIWIATALFSACMSFGCNLEGEKKDGDNDGGVLNAADDDDNNDDSKNSDDDDDNDDAIKSDDDDDNDDAMNPLTCLEGEVCWPHLESRTCPEGYEPFPDPEKKCRTEEGWDGNCCVPQKPGECETNDDCAVVPAGCCSCGLWEYEFTVIPESEEAKYLDELKLQCADVMCEPCPPTIPQTLPYAYCSNDSDKSHKRICRLGFIKSGCFIPEPEHCIPSTTTNSDGCPSNWGICGCTYKEDDFCRGMGAPIQCDYDEQKCPTDCECEGPVQTDYPEYPEAYACLSDEDCVEVPAGCCSCGGASINKEYVAQWNSWLFDSNYCADVDCAPPEWCEPGLPICYYGRCSLEKPTEPWQCRSGEECLLGAPCDCDKDLFGCAIQRCVGRTKACRDHSECQKGEQCWYGDGCALTPTGVECNPNGDGYCHSLCSDNDSCVAGYTCYGVENCFGDYCESISVCLDIY